MRRDDWLETLERAHDMLQLGELSDLRARVLRGLEQLEATLEDAAPKRPLNADGLYSFYTGIRLSPEERARAERAAARLWQSSGTGRTYAEEALLGQVAVQARPESLPFFRAAVEASRARDKFQPRRRQIAVASVAFLVKQGGDAAAHAQLEAWLSHPDVTVRAEAVDHYARLHLDASGKLDASARARLQELAREDPGFAPRYLARGWLLAAGEEPIVDAPKGLLVLRVKLSRATRTLEIETRDTLVGLASAILDAFDWDHDHLYEFALTGDLEDARFILPRRDEEGWRPPELAALEEDDDEEPPAPDEADPMYSPLGAFGLRVGNEFIFRFDFGDEHHFQVKVLEVRETKRKGTRYPRVSAREGRAPEQYAR